MRNLCKNKTFGGEVHKRNHQCKSCQNLNTEITETLAWHLSPNSSKLWKFILAKLSHLKCWQCCIFKFHLDSQTRFFFSICLHSLIQVTFNKTKLLPSDRSADAILFFLYWLQGLLPRKSKTGNLSWKRGRKVLNYMLEKYISISHIWKFTLELLNINEERRKEITKQIK